MKLFKEPLACLVLLIVIACVWMSFEAKWYRDRKANGAATNETWLTNYVTVTDTKYGLVTVDELREHKDMRLRMGAFIGWLVALESPSACSNGVEAMEISAQVYYSFSTNELTYEALRAKIREKLRK